MLGRVEAGGIFHQLLVHLLALLEARELDLDVLVWLKPRQQDQPHGLFHVVPHPAKLVTTISASRFVAPITEDGFTALSVDTSKNACVPCVSAAEQR